MDTQNTESENRIVKIGNTTGVTLTQFFASNTSRNSWEEDIEPANKIGLHTYWIAEKDTPLPQQADSLLGQGSLDDFETLMTSGRLP